MPEGVKKSGSVMVIGAGIAGIQSALDLADAGFRVYLVEEGMSIGGAMPQLDKTFPTNDCSMCILAPRLVDAGRHPNIEILCNSEITALEGEVGDFQATVSTRSVFVDPEKCNGCGDCVEECPVSVPSPFDEKIGRCKAIDRPFPQAIPNVFGIRKDGLAPCRVGCPAEANVQGYLALAAKGKWAEALNLIRQKIPFPGTLGRICHHPCELKCNRVDVDDPVAIRDIKRFIADYIYEHPELEKSRREKIEERRKKNREEGSEYIDPFERDDSRGKDFRVAVIGAGPAGLTAAADLSMLGYEVEIFESEEESGGMMKWVIPDFRLDKDYLNRELDAVITENNLKIHYGKQFGKDISLKHLREQGFQAIFLGVGAQKSRGLKVKGGELEGVYPGLDFIRMVNRTKFDADAFTGKKVVVLGGGNVAMDASRMALRLGGDVTIVYRRALKQMPATAEEIEMAKQEGIEFLMLANPVNFLGDKSVTGMKLIRMKLGEPDDSGRRRPVPIEGSEFDFPCDAVIMAIGQNVETEFLEKEGLELEWNTLKIDPVSYQTSMEDVFAGGDVSSGPASVVEALRAGHEAAISIDRFLHGEDIKEGRGLEPELSETPHREHYEKKERPRQEHAPVKERVANFREVEKTLTKEQVLAEASRCLDCGLCSECMECVLACGRGAVDHNRTDVSRTIRAGAVILSPGYEKYMPRNGGSLGFDLYPNVVTSIQFERMLSASGPFSGHVTRPSDEKEPKKIAWLQCVGSRDESCDRPYCSSVCCMYSTKEAVIAKEHLPGLETHIYYMDIRSFGKNFEKYIDRAKEEYGVVYRDSRIPRVEQNPKTSNLIIRYVGDDGAVLEEEYDMVVLSVGIQPCEKEGDLGKLLDIQLNKYGFIQTDPYYRSRTTREGVYAAGVITEPKDIPESVTEASSAAASAASGIYESRGLEVTEKQYPEERDIMDEPPRVGVFVCHCGTNIAGVVDVSSIVEKAKLWPHVVFAENTLYACSQDTQEIMKEKIREHGINRVVVASCTPRTHEALFQDTIREAGLNPFLFQMANIRDQCSWVHRDSPEIATIKAAELVRMAVSKAAKMYPVQRFQVPLVQKALVIGGGVSGMNAALSIANQGFRVYLAEKEPELGGRLREVFYGFLDEDPQQLLKKLVEEVTNHENITVFTGAKIKEVTGYIGDFTSRVETDKGIEELEHGVVIAATGALPAETDEFLYGKSDRVMVQTELEKIMHDNENAAESWKEVVMIQCVGSRNDEHPWCSRVCCSEAIRNAIMIKENNPDARIYILYRDIRTYGFREDYLYRRARDKGIIFIRYPDDKPPSVEKDGDQIKVKLPDHVLKRNLVFRPDALVLSTGMIPGDNREIAELLKIPVNEDGFFAEAHAKLRPVDFANDGIYLCGTAHSPRFIEESITQAGAVASRAARVLSKETLETSGIVVQVNPRKCTGCEVCVDICAYDAREYDPEKGYVTVNEVLCQGCGACAAACPNKATRQNKFTAKQIFSMINVLYESEPKKAGAGK